MKAKQEPTNEQERKKNPMLVPLTRLEANVLLRALATANDAERTEPSDVTVGGWLAQRLRVALEEERGE